MTNVNGILYFNPEDNVHGEELWKSDGTAEGTVLVKDINPGSGSSEPEELTNLNGTLFFSANDGVNGYALWKSDGTAGGTQLVKDISPSELTDVDGMLFFSATGGLWKSDGTPDGTQLVKYIYVSELANVNGTLFFRVWVSGDTGPELWKSDGTAEGTVFVKSFFPGDWNSDPSYPDGFADVDGTLFFRADDGVNGVELWKSDGTTNGTVMVKDIYPGSDEGYPNESKPQALTNVNGMLFFSADDGFHVHGRELWVSDGTPDGTVLVDDILPMDKDHNGSGPRDLTEVNGTLFFTADDGLHGYELWALEIAAGFPHFVHLPVILK